MFTKMANVLFSVIVLLFINQVSAKGGCDDCVRLGGTWCKDMKFQDTRCVTNQLDDWCPVQKEDLPIMDIKQTKSAIFDPVFYERTIKISDSGAPITRDISFKSDSKNPRVYINSTSTTKSSFEALVLGTKCDNSKCISTVQVSIQSSFCTQNSSPYEYARVNFTVESIDETAILNYHVPCACNCTAQAQKKSPICNYHGDLECGACFCHGVWTGQYCDKANCTHRGDMRSCVKSAFSCNGNGECDDCESCVCYPDREGSQYFDANNNCKDLCMVTSECDTCLLNGTLGLCSDCNHHMTIQKYNESLTTTRDSLGRKDWVTCNVTVVDCYVEYVTMMNDHGDIQVMVVRSCNDKIAAGQGAAAQAPMIVGILFGVVLLAAAAGFLMWKHLNAAPPLPLNDGGYCNIDAEDCVGENPLYKSPTSSFKNPTYGKW